MPRTSWRDRYRPIIGKIIEENKGLPLREIQKKLREACPITNSFPYRAWCLEVRLQLKLPLHPRKQKQAEEAEKKRGQGRMF